MKEFRDAVVAESYTDKDGVEKTSWYKVGKLMIDGEKMTFFCPILSKPVNFFKPKKREADNADEIKF